MTTQAIYDLGYALCLYAISADRRTWRFNEEEFVLPFDAVPVINLLGFSAARIEDVRQWTQPS